jgi:DNA-binding phage protein
VTTQNTFGARLKQHMEVELGRTNWRRSLAKQVAEQTGQNPENARRMLYKWIDEGVDPQPESRKAVTDALGLQAGALDPDDEEESLYNALVSALDRAKLLAAIDRAKAAA